MRQDTSSTRFFIQMIINVFVCRKAQEIIAKRTSSEQKRSFNSYMLYVMFVIILLGSNHTIFMFFKDANLYQELGVPRSATMKFIKQWSQSKKRQLIQIYTNTQQLQMQYIKIVNITNILTHPARRLSYDSFGVTDGEYAWAFKYPSFILSTIMGSGIFFVICTAVSMINKKKSDLKQAFKVQIFTMILLFIWQVDLIISSQKRFNSTAIDFVDNIYFALPIFQRRELLKSLVIPCMSLVQIFVRFYIKSPAQKKIIEYATLDKLNAHTRKVRQAIGDVKNDDRLEDTVGVALQSAKHKMKIQTEIYKLHRQNLMLLVDNYREQLVANPGIGRIFQYFILR